MKNNKKKGFTLVELLVVIAILAILATVSTVGYTAFVQKAKDSNALTELTQIEKLIETDLMDDGKLAFTVKETVGEGDAATEENATYVIEKLNGALVCTRNDVAYANVAEALAKHADIAAALDGTLTVDGVEITYNTTEGGKATVTID